MMRVFVFAALICFALAAPVIKQDWLYVNVGNASYTNAPAGILPHAASFSDGRYIIVYTLRTDDSMARVHAQIFNANHTVAVPEFDLEPFASSINAFSSPNVAVFPDDSYMITYKWDSGDPASVTARFFLANNTEARSPVQADNPSVGVSTTKGDVKLVGFSDYGFAIFYYSEAAGCHVAVVRDSDANLVLSSCIYDSTADAMATSVTTDSLGSVAYAVSKTNSNNLNAGQVSQTSLGFLTSWSSTSTFRDPAIALGGDNVVTILHNSLNSTYYSVTDSYFSGFSHGNISTADEMNIYTAHAVLALAERKVFLGYRSYNISDTTSILTYQTANIDYNEFERLDLTLNMDRFSFNTNLYAFQFIPLTGSDILVIGKEGRDSVTGDILRQIISFCGNNELDLDEECDGSANCDENCRCTSGSFGYEGVCGLPNVRPTLDCVEQTSEGYKLFFSFLNQDRVAHTLPQGAINSFYPATYASDRPTEFPVGESLTYPASPYSALIAATETEFNWLLGSYNLTVDLTDVNALLCPTTVRFVAEITTPSVVDETIALSFANRYEVSYQRVSASVNQIGGTAKKRSVNFYQNRFAATVSVAPAEDNVDEPSAAEAVKAVVEEFKDESTREEVATSLVSGNDDANVKSVTPSPTDVEVRGTRYDSSNSIPPSATPSSTSPSASNQPQSSTPVSNTPQSSNISGSSVLLPTMVVFVATVGLIA